MLFTDKVVFVETLVPNVGNTDQETYTTFNGFKNNAGVATNAVRMNIQPAKAEIVALSDGVFGKTFVGFTTNSGIIEGMRLTVSGTGDKYIVRGRQIFDYGIGKHYEVVLNKFELP